MVGAGVVVRGLPLAILLALPAWVVIVLLVVWFARLTAP
jgi:hypothetical protein